LSKAKEKKLSNMEVLPVRVTVLRRNKSLLTGLTSIALDR
jgi:hypothetical protein